VNSYNTAVAQAFDRWSPSYEQEVLPKLLSRGYSYEELASKVVSALDGKPSTTGRLVFEIGVGTGVLGARVSGLLHADDRLQGLDISEGMLEEARAKKAYGRLHLSSADEFSFDDAYDLIYTAFVFHSVRDQAKLLGRLRQVVSASTPLVVVDLFPQTQDVLRESQEHSAKYEYGAPSNYLTTKQFEGAVNDAGLTVAEKSQLGHSKDYMHYFYKLS
jgi:predicted TPR repeat methyltransferase